MANESSPAAKIAAQETVVARLRRDLEIAEAELRGMKAMLPAAPTAPTASSDVWERGIPKLKDALLGPTKGRQPGAISRQWRETLAMLRMNYPFPGGFTEYNAATAAQAAGLPNVRPKDALDRLTAYLSHGYVERLADGKWLVTDLAAKKYRFPDKGAPTGEPMEASPVETEEAS